jgi:hypothetical protein
MKFKINNMEFYDEKEYKKYIKYVKAIEKIQKKIKRKLNQDELNFIMLNIRKPYKELIKMITEGGIKNEE